MRLRHRVDADATDDATAIGRLRVVVALAILIVGAVVACVAVACWRGTIAQWQERLSSVATQRAQTIDAWLRERRADAEVVASFPTVIAMASGGSLTPVDTRRIEIVLERLRTAYGYGQVAVFDAAGRSLARVGQDSPAGVENAAVLSAVARSGRPEFSAQLDGSGHSWVLVSAPVHGSAGEAAGAVVLTIDPESSLLSLIGREEVATRTGETVLVARHGEGAVSVTPVRLAGGYVSYDARALARSAAGPALAGEDRFGEFADYRGVRVFAATRRMEHADWGLAVKIDRTEAMAPFWSELWRVAGAGVVVVCSIVLFALAEARRHHTHHLEQMLRHERMLRDERARAEAEVRRWAAELERRVEERTEALAAANRELEAFNYSVSHDLRAPLRHIEGFTRALGDELGGEISSEARRYLDRIATSSERMRELIEALLRLSQVGRAQLTPRPMAVGDVARAAFADLRHGVEGRSVEFVVGDLPEALADPALVRVLFDNLLANAIKFTRPVPSARIEVGVAREEEGMPVFFVRDTGVGFDPAFADKLFGVFQRLHSREEFEGNGIGLSIVHRIVVRHGGRVWAEGAPGAGATFYFTLGRHRAASETAQVP